MADWSTSLNHLRTLIGNTDINIDAVISTAIESIETIRDVQLHHASSPPSIPTAEDEEGPFLSPEPTEPSPPHLNTPLLPQNTGVGSTDTTVDIGGPLLTSAESVDNRAHNRRIFAELKDLPLPFGMAKEAVVSIDVEGAAEVPVGASGPMRNKNAE